MGSMGFFDTSDLWNDNFGKKCPNKKESQLDKNTKLGEFHYVYKNAEGHDVPGIDFITLGMLAPEAQADLIRGYKMRIK